MDAEQAARAGCGFASAGYLVSIFAPLAILLLFVVIALIAGM